MIRPRLLRKAGWMLREEPKLKHTFEEVGTREDLASPGLGACLGCAMEVSLRFALKVLGRNTILFLPAGCAVAVGTAGFGRTTGLKIPVVMPLLTQAASLPSGVKRHFLRQGIDANVVVFAGDATTADLGFASVSGAAERGENIIYICYDNEGPMNTGYQRGSTTSYMAATPTTPVGTVTRGKGQPAKDVPLIMAMHRVAYVATASIAYPYDYRAKLERAMRVKDGFVYIHLLSPCVSGWRFDSEMTMEVGRMAVESNAFPLWEADHGRLRITKRVAFPRPVKDYLQLQGRFRHLSDAEVSEIQKMANRRLRELEALTRIR
ncbi:MAG: thiamine pyrophosphate-dependent enzyme [Chloroflexota bacterium]